MINPVNNIFSHPGYTIFEKKGINKGTGIRIPAAREMNAARLSFSRREVTKKVKKNRNINIPDMDRNTCMM